MNSCHEEWGAAVSDEMLAHGVGGGCIRHLAGRGGGGVSHSYPPLAFTDYAYPGRRCKGLLAEESGPDLGNGRLSHHQDDPLAHAGSAVYFQLDSGPS
eukprot:gene7887-biopygen2603